LYAEIAMIGKKNLELLQFDKIINLIQQKCHSKQARLLCEAIFPKEKIGDIIKELNQVNELKTLLSAQGFFPSVEHEDVSNELSRLGLEGSMLHETQLLMLQKTVEVSNSLIRFLKGKKSTMPYLYDLVQHVEASQQVVEEIEKVIDVEARVKNNASPELSRIRKQVAEKRRESDKRFYNYIHELRRHGYLRENEESFFNGRRTLAVLVEYKSEVPGFVHDKSESGKTIFIEPGATIAINNEVAELEIDEQREINRILRELCGLIRPFVPALKEAIQVLIYTDFLKAKALFAVDLKANLPELTETFELNVVSAVHPLLFLQNKQSGKKTVPLNLELNSKDRILVISGPNAGGKTIALKTIGLLQIMLQSGLLVPVKETSSFCFFEKILIDIGDTQSIENELSTYSAKLKSMTSILEDINEATLVLMDEFGSGTDPELGSAIAEAVLESLVSSKTKGIITSHFGNVKLLAEKLDGAINGCMLFDIDNLEPKYILSVGEPGSSYTFEVAERIGFPKHLIERAKGKVDKDKIKLNRLLADMQDQKTKLEEQLQRAEHEEFLKKIAKEKYHTLFNAWEEKINRERERKIELSHLADYGSKYLRLMDDWNKRKDRKEVIQRFIDGITAETKKQEDLRKQKKLSNFSEKKIARIKPVLKVGSKVKVLNGNEVGVVEEIKEEKVFIKFGLMKMTVGMENLVLAEA
jgi:DNA mismatch repair protein MutS2